jgi:hypothetical protein
VSLVVAVTQAEIVAWTCFVVGIALLAAGVVLGLRLSAGGVEETAADARAKVEEAQARLADARGHIEQTSAAIATSDLEGVGASTGAATEAVEAAGASAEEATSALEQVQGIVAALPENLRFAGLLIVVGTVLMGVATVQFGKVSLF